MIDRYLREVGELASALDRDALTSFADVLFDAWRNRRTIYLCGNGGSASTAQHMAADLFKCTIVAEKARVRALSLNDNMPLISALTNDEGWGEVYVEQLRTWWCPGDVVIGISVHGGVGQDRAGAWSQNVLAACLFAEENGGTALGIVGFDGGAMAKCCRVVVRIPVESTPHTEGLAVVVHHLVTTALRAKIERA